MKRHLFSRKLKCGFCGAALQRHKIIQGVYYTCDGLAWNGTNDCKSIRLFETDLVQAVLSSIRFQAQLAARAEERLDRQVKDVQAAQSRTMSAQQRIQRRISQLEVQKAETYLDFDLGEISQAQYRERCIKLGSAITEQKRKLDALAQTGDSVLSYADTTELGQLNGLKTLHSLQTLDRDMVETLIHSIQMLAAEEDALMRNGN